MLARFWRWYNKHYGFNVRLSTALFLLQIIHLVWLGTHAISLELTGRSLFPQNLSFLIALVDYTEIPALIGVSLIYINEIVGGTATRKTYLLLALLLSQVLHMFWITDEIVLVTLAGAAPIAIPRALAFVAIAIDYLEVPVMVDTARRSFKIKR
ncbi:hypothetical protein HYZ64_02805 [Candidatus Berkelbacteria bacterium]|nr:hypothetical protein [Candidatus Berkelbacteria bacterium]